MSRSQRTVSVCAEARAHRGLKTEDSSIKKRNRSHTPPVSGSQSRASARPGTRLHPHTPDPTRSLKWRSWRHPSLAGPRRRPGNHWNAVAYIGRTQEMTPCHQTGRHRAAQHSTWKKLPLKGGDLPSLAKANFTRTSKTNSDLRGGTLGPAKCQENDQASANRPHWGQAALQGAWGGDNTQSFRPAVKTPYEVKSRLRSRRSSPRGSGRSPEAPRSVG